MFNINVAGSTNITLTNNLTFSRYINITSTGSLNVYISTYSVDLSFNSTILKVLPNTNITLTKVT